MSDRKRRVISGGIASSGSSLVLQLTSLLVIPLYLDLTSQELFGLWLTLGAMLGWIKIGDMGLGLALTRNSIEAIAASNYELLSRLIFGVIFLTIIFGALVSGTAYFFTDNIISIFKISNELEGSFKSTFHILLFVAFIRPSFTVFNPIIEAKQHIAFVHIKNTTVTLMSIAFTILLLFLDFGIISFAYGLLFEALIMPFIDISYLRIIDSKILFFPIKTSKKDILSLLRIGAPFQVLKIANLIATNTDNLIIASIIGLSSLTTYVFTGKLAFLLGVFFISVLPSVLFPGVTELFVKGDRKKIRDIYFKLSDFSIRLGLFSGISYFFINELFINEWVGSKYFGGMELTAVFVIWIIFESFIRGITSIILASGQIKSLALVSFFEAFLNICITLILIKSLGLVGVVLGTVLSRIVTLLYIPFKINKILNINNSKYLKMLIKSIVIYLLPMLIIGSTINSYLDKEINPFIQIIILGFTIFAASVSFHEGIFIIRQRGKTWKERIGLLKKRYYSA